MLDTPDDQIQLEYITNKQLMVATSLLAGQSFSFDTAQHPTG